MSHPTILVTGLPASGKTTLARAVSQALGMPLLSKDVVKESLFGTLSGLDRAEVSHAANEVLWALLSDCPGGAVVEIWLDPRRDVGIAADVLARAGSRVAVEIMCICPGDIAAQRYAARARPPPHLPPDEATLQRIRDSADLMQPLGVGPVLPVDTTGPSDVDRITAWITASADHLA